MICIKLSVSTFALIALLRQSEAIPTGPGDAAVQLTRTQIEAAFKTVDTDGNGQITKDQLKQVMQSTDRFHTRTEGRYDTMVDIVMIVADSDEDNMIGEGDIVKAICTDMEEGNDAYFAAFFKVFDKDSSGGLNEQELAKVDQIMNG